MWALPWIWLPTLLVLCGFAAFWRSYRLATDPLTCETQNFMWGMRLYHLPWLNVRDDLLDNALKSLLGTIGGIRWALSAYVISGLYYVLGIGLTESNFLMFYALLGVALVVLTFALARVWGNPPAALLAAAAIAVNPRVIFASRWDDAEPTVSVAVCVGVLMLFGFGRTRSPFRAALFGVVLALLFSMESLMIFPLFLLYAWSAWTPAGSSPAARLKSLAIYLVSREGVVMMAPLLVAVAAHIAAFLTVGGEGNNLGLFGLMKLNYAQRVTLSTLWPRLLFVANHYADHFFGIRFLTATVAAFVAALLLNGGRYPDACLKYSSWGAAYFFVAFVALPGILVNADHMYIPEALNAIFIAASWVAFGRAILAIARRRLPGSVVPLRIAIGAAVTVAIAASALADTTSALERPVLIHPFKSIGYYVRTHGGTDARVFNLWECEEVCFHQLSEFYYGKQFINVGDRSTNPRKIFCDGSASNDEILAAYGLDEFTLFVRVLSVYQAMPNGTRAVPFHGGSLGASTRALDRLKAAGVHKVADVTHNGEVLAEIYSRRDLPQLTMALEQYDRRWAQEYGRVDRLLEGRRVGIVSIFGPHFDLKRGF